jgi:hypothetical protein
MLGQTGFFAACLDLFSLLKFKERDCYVSRQRLEFLQNVVMPTAEGFTHGKAIRHHRAMPQVHKLATLHSHRLTFAVRLGMIRSVLFVLKPASHGGLFFWGLWLSLARHDYTPASSRRGAKALREADLAVNAVQ